MNSVGLIHLSKIRHEDLLREAEQHNRIFRSPRFRKLPKLVQILILILS